LLALSRCRPSGLGLLDDYPIEQYVRDAKIDTLYEGTTAIQGQDLFFRKIVKDRGRALAIFRRRSSMDRREGGNGQLKEERALLQQGLDDVRAIVDTMINDLGRSVPGSSHSDPRNVYKVGLNTTDC
jgi:hypothetical protein